uniref:Helix-turn-helix domain-containing protein n=2 Tax=Schistocephalus solidus TaxID=70667 RepID=A0A0V0J6P4_SCHSO
MKEEEKNQLAFLDVLVCRKDCVGLKTKVFREMTNATQALNFNSKHPITSERSCARKICRCIKKHCRETKDKVSAVECLQRVLIANGYSRIFVKQCISKRSERPNSTGPKFWLAL